jgi:hypothetical protein
LLAAAVPVVVIVAFMGAAVEPGAFLLGPQVSLQEPIPLVLERAELPVVQEIQVQTVL